MNRQVTILITTVVSCTILVSIAARNNEKLTIQPLGNKLVHARFEFRTTTSPGDIERGHYHLFPKALGEVLSKYDVEELDLSLTQGMWRYRYWGIPLEGASNPSGASIMAIFKHETEDVDSKWNGLVNSLAGLICASLNFADKKRTITPKYTFSPRGVVDSERKFDLSLLRYVSLPEEFVCTENLTPWKKLLPCFGKAGLSSLLGAKRLFESNYHSISITVRPVCSNEQCDSVKTQLTQALSVVLDHNRGYQGDAGKFSVKSLFGSPVSTTCAIASTSEVVIKSPESGTLAINLDPTSAEVTTKDGFTYSSFPVTPNFDVSVSYQTPSGYAIPDPPMLYAHRFLSGYGQELGSIVCEIHNNAEEDVQIIYTDYIPWYLRMYVHTLSIETNVGVTVKPSKMAYTPGLDRKKAYMLELLLNLPANSTTTIRFDIEKLFLKWTEYLPDANFGFYIPAAIITAVLPDAPQDTTIQSMKEGYGVVRLYTEKLIVLLPTPDFSMPYNVICLACTVVALAFGSWYNLSTKTMIRLTGPPTPFMTKIMTKIKALFFVSKDSQPNADESKDADKATANEQEGKNEESKPKTE